MRRRRKRRRGLVLIVLLVAIVCLAVLYKTGEVKEQISIKQEKIDKLNSQIKEQEERTKTLYEQKEYQKTKKYIEDVAREKLHLIYPGEIIYEEKSDN